MSSEIVHGQSFRESSVRGTRGTVRFYELKWIEDQTRGHLSVGEFGRTLPFVPRRYFATYAMPVQSHRGQHAHRECEQLLVCLHGSCRVKVTDGTREDEFLLNQPHLGVYLPPMVWAEEYDHRDGCVLLVFASHDYEAADYIRDYEDFKREVGS
jgi:UDP-2-acetamido-3-amino-2,3-dideoxy-glucuronate N-acetyltransferase